MTSQTLAGRANADAALVFALDTEQRMAQARERFFDFGERPSGLVPEPVIQSWSRCLTTGRAPGELLEFNPVRRGRASDLLARNYGLLEESRTEFDRLEKALAGTSATVVLADRHGAVLRYSRVDDHVAPLLHAGCRIGVDLSEASVGTSAIAVATASGRTVRVKGKEHFFEQMQGLNCVCAPIHDPRGRVSGVLNISSENRTFAFDSNQLVTLAASLIENRLFLRWARDLVIVEVHAFPALLGTPLAGLLGIDFEGSIRWINAAACAQLGWNIEDARGAQAEAVLGWPLSTWLGRCSEAQARVFNTPNGVELWAKASAPRAAASVPAVASLPGSAARTLSETSHAHIVRALADAGGNIASAARSLGVSRGLLYRRLKAAERQEPEDPPGA